MILRRAESDPATAINELTRDMARIRSDLDSLRSALTTRGREMMSKSTARALRQTGEYVRQHPGAATGVVVGLLLVLMGLAFGLGRSQR